MERDNEREMSFIVRLLVDDISVAAACDCHFQTAWQMTGSWLRDNTRITKERKKNRNQLSVGRQEARCLLGFGYFSSLTVCVYSMCMWSDFSHGCVHIWEIMYAGLDASMCAHMQMCKNNA